MPPHDEPRSKAFHAPRRSASEQLNQPWAANVEGVFQPLPRPAGAAPFRLELADVLGQETVAAIEKKGAIAFHTVGDTGGIKSPEYQQIVADWMERDLASADPAPSFFYHLGDVVYYYGQRASYYDQFYEPYKHYPAPIVAIPGNHDGDVTPGDTQDPPEATSLDGFTANFCTKEPGHAPEAQDVPRLTMVQPNVYWTLTAPLVTIVGLYTNVPDDGQVEADQAAWFISELAEADAGKALIVALHHPVYSADAHHGSSPVMQQLLDKAFADAKRTPDLVLTGHVHNYQRFSRPLNGGRALTYLVAGAGGYWHLHYMAYVDGKLPDAPWTDPQSGVTLEAYNREHRHGFLRLTVTEGEITGSYQTVPHPHESWTTGPVAEIDTFTIEVQKPGPPPKA